MMALRKAAATESSSRQGPPDSARQTVARALLWLAMTAGIIARLTRGFDLRTQTLRRVFALLLIGTLLAPTLGGLLPSPALSAAAGVEQAAALSLCTTPGGSQDDGGTNPQHNGHCQACVLGCGICCATPTADLPAAQADQPRQAPRGILIAAAESQENAPRGRPLQPRAPPASLT